MFLLFLMLMPSRRLILSSLFITGTAISRNINIILKPN